MHVDVDGTVPSYLDETIRKLVSQRRQPSRFTIEMSYPRCIEVSPFPGLTVTLGKKTKGQESATWKRIRF